MTCFPCREAGEAHKCKRGHGGGRDQRTVRDLLFRTTKCERTWWAEAAHDVDDEDDAPVFQQALGCVLQA